MWHAEKVGQDGGEQIAARARCRRPRLMVSTALPWERSRSTEIKHLPAGQIKAARQWIMNGS
jgi:hypothetical protein